MSTKPNKPFAVGGMNVVSPKGKALWCKVNEPDRKFDSEGTLSTQLVCDPNDPAVQKFIERLETLQDTAFAESVETLGEAKGKQIRKRLLYTDHCDQDGNPTGNIVFKFALKGVDKRASQGKPSTIAVVDAHKQAVNPVPNVGNDSEIRVGAFVYPYYMAMSKEIGLSMMWTKMQIIDLVEYGGGSGGSDFDEEEGFATVATSADEDF